MLYNQIQDLKKMAIIEGIGDEVIQFLLVIILLLIGIVAWRSTGLSDRQIIRTVLILERRSRHQVLAELPVSSNSANDSSENTIDTGQETNPPDENAQEEASGESAGPKVDESPESSSTSQELECNENQEVLSSCQTDSNPDVSETPTNTSTEPRNQSVDESLSSVLRQRRIAFFQSRQETLLEHHNGNTGDIMEVSYVSSDQEEGDNIMVASTSGITTPPPGNIRIRLKYLNDDQKLVEGRLEEMLGDFKRRHFAIELAADKLVRLIFNGQVLQHDSETLKSLGLFDNCVVHCLVHQQRARSNSNNAGSPVSRRGSSTATSSNTTANDVGAQRDWDLGNLLFASLSVILGVAWYCRYQYAALFNTTTTVALLGMTGVLLVTLVGLYLPDPDYVRH